MPEAVSAVSKWVLQQWFRFFHSQSGDCKFLYSYSTAGHFYQYWTPTFSVDWGLSVAVGGMTTDCHAMTPRHSTDVHHILELEPLSDKSLCRRSYTVRTSQVINTNYKRLKHERRPAAGTDLLPIAVPCSYGAHTMLLYKNS